MKSRNTTIAAVLAALAFVPACKKLDEGVNAYHRGEYAVALGLLQELADNQAAEEPGFKVKAKEAAAFPEAIREITGDYFRGWEAYVGSQFGLERIEEGCAALALALRPVRFARGGSALPPPDGGGADGRWDPRAGEYWPPQAMTLRSWLFTIPCPDSSSR